MTTVEGLLRDTIADLGENQPLRRIENEAAYNKIQSIIDRAKDILGDKDEEEDEDTTGPVQVKRAADLDAPMKPFTVTIDDPAGNSFLEFIGGMSDPKWNMRTYKRTRQQNIDLGLISADAEPEPETAQEDRIGGGLEGENEEIYIFPGSCSSCGHKSDTLIKKVNIPYFKVSSLYPDHADYEIDHLISRTFLSCLSIATFADTATTKSSPAPQYQRRDGRSR